MDLGIKGKKAIVCASSKGLGKACAEFLAADGVDDWVVLQGVPDAEGVVRPRDLAGYDAMRAEMPAAVGADGRQEEPVASGSGTETLSAMRAAYRRILLGIAASDIGDGAPFLDVAAALSDLADATLATALAQTPITFVMLQMLTRAFMLTAAGVGIVMLAEELKKN